MRRFIPYIACGLLLVSGWACTRTDDMDIPSANQDKIVIKTSLDPHVVTRAADVEAERKITRIDVFVVEGDGDIFLHETHDTQNNFDAADGNGTLALKKARKDFPVNESYNVYLLANATADIESDLNDAKTLDALKAIVHEAFTSTKSVNEVTGEESTTKHTMLHLSGTTEPKADAPQTFMMDAVATTSSSTSKAVVLNDGVTTNNTSLVAEFKRAAAKIIVNIKQGESVQFERYLLEENVNQGSAEYVFYNLPTETPILADAEALLSDNNTLIETDAIVLPRTASTDETIPDDFPTFTWKDNVGSVKADGTGDVKIQIVGYAYAHNWENKPTLNFEPSLLLCLPMYWDANKDLNTPESDGKETMRPGNWYKVPLSEDKVFERNTCYVVNITINAVGAESKSEAIELDDIDYDTRPWEVTTIEIGDDTTTPQYLKLNTDLVKMYNTNVDSEQLIFSSSSPITSIVLADVYEQNADGEFIPVEQDAEGNYFEGDGHFAYYLNKYSQNRDLSASMFEVSNLATAVNAKAEAGKLSGNITITSPIGPDEAKLNEELAKLVKPIHPGPAPQAPDGYVEFSETPPSPASYVPSTTRVNGEWVYERTSSNRDYYKRVVTFTQYRYNSGEGKFEYRTAQAEEEGRTQRNPGDNPTISVYGTSASEDRVNWSDYDTCSEDDEHYLSYLTRYNEDYYAYLERKAAYEATLDTEEYKAYKEELDSYNEKLTAYTVAMAEYNNKVAQIEQTYGDIPETHYNSVRYLEFLVTNEEGLTAIFRVEQYPTIFIKNIVGWYSYRDDFYVHDSAPDSPTSYKYSGDRIVGITYNSTSKSYTYNTSVTGFWRSKVNMDANGNNISTAQSFDQRYYTWDSGATSPSTSTRATAGGTNSRMYHIQVTTSSPRYTVGRPILVDPDTGLPTVDVDNGVTAGDMDNSKLVSPSFMTASQLGYFDTSITSLASNTSDQLAIVREHCKNYVEVASDGTEFHNWRLPTASEIQIIVDLQGNANDLTVAIDKVLNASQYFSASGLVTVPGNSSFVAVRCVRDAYDD